MNIDWYRILIKYMSMTIILFTILQKSESKELPANFPPFDIRTLDKPSPGIMMFATRGNGYGSYLIMTDSAANVLNFRPVTGVTSNFSVQPNGQLTFNTVVQGYFKAYSEARYYITDNELNLIDSIVSGNGFVPAPHASEILPNGHYLYSSFEAHHIDMSKVVPNGNPNAVVAGALLIEMDIDKNVVFQWSSWDYIDIKDTYQPINDFLNITTLYSNFNSVAVDPDGNYLICNRLLSEIIKVNRATGEIMWRLGGKYNDFTFINDNPDYNPHYFSMQHDVRLLSNGNIVLFDNGDQHNPPASRGIEYKIDEVNKTAELVWQYAPEAGVFSQSNGSTQRLPNGNAIIGWGNTTTDPNKLDITEVDKNNKVVFEMVLPKNINAFKAIKFPYPIGKESAKVMKDELLPLNTYKFDNNFGKTGVTVVFSGIEGFMYNSITITKYNYSPLYPRFEGTVPNVAPYRYYFETYGFDNFLCEISFDLSGMEWMINPEKYTVYVRENEKSGVFTPLETTYDAVNNQLIAKTTMFGEFAFAKNYESNIPGKPFLTSPANNATLLNKQKIEFAWNPKGFFRKSHIQISKDADFSSITFESNNLIPTKLSVENLDENTTYYWRVASVNDTQIGEWSEVFSFITKERFIKITEPNGGETWEIDSIRKFVRWDKNIVEPVRIQLLLDGEVVHTVIDSLVSHTGAYAFKLPNVVKENDKYKIRIINIENNNLITESEDFFTIKNSTVSVDDLRTIGFEIKNYPNPFSEVTNFEFSCNESGLAEISIFSLDGKYENCIYSSFVNTGKSFFEWKNNELPSGNYIIKFSLNGKSLSNKISIIK